MSVSVLGFLKQLLAAVMPTTDSEACEDLWSCAAEVAPSAGRIIFWSSARLFFSLKSVCDLQCYPHFFAICLPASVVSCPRGSVYNSSQARRSDVDAYRPLMLGDWDYPRHLVQLTDLVILGKFVSRQSSDLGLCVRCTHVAQTSTGRHRKTNSRWYPVQSNGLRVVMKSTGPPRRC